MIEEPKRRKDGKCFVCKKPIPVVKHQRGVPTQLYKTDPFCSTRCAREYFGTSLPPTGFVDPDFPDR